MVNKKYVYLFSEGEATMKGLLGGKGANLAEMTRLDLPIPQGFTITTEACNAYYESAQTLSQEVVDQIEAAIQNLEEIAQKRFADNADPLLVSVRSGARASMPGMMDTILNLGLNDIAVEGLAAKTNNKRFAYDSYRRFIQMFSDVVMELDKYKFERILQNIKDKKGVKNDTDLTAEDLQEVTAKYKDLYLQEMGKPFPEDPKEQLLAAVEAVFRSWNNPRAVYYRRLNDIPSEWGTAVNIQIMVFGNMGDSSGTGVAFTRNPATGEKKIFGEYLINAQGEDVVAGIRTPNEISTLEQEMPEVYGEFLRIANTLEKHYKDMQDMEFTIENGKLYFLQTRNGKRTANAALQIAVDLVEEKLATPAEVLLKVDPKQLDQLLHPAFDQQKLAAEKPLAKGLAASPGAGSGRVVFEAEEAKIRGRNGERVILVRQETSPEDLEGMVAAQGILTARGGMTSHAAVVARGMGKCCVAGCSALNIHEKEKYFTVDNQTIKEGDYISLDGSTGNVYLGDIETVVPKITGNFAKFMSWADETRKLKVRANADTPEDAKKALEFGAEGIGLCRTEHMFFEESRIFKVRKMILANREEQRRKALAELLPVQKEDFKGLFEAMAPRPVTIRLLDPPLHEFLPKETEAIAELASDMQLSPDDLQAKIESLHEFNPMMGHRGCRLAVTYPEIAEMQTQAIIEAALEIKKEKGIDIKPEIMIPLVGEIKELKYVKNIVEETAKKIISASGMQLDYLVGTMIEVPRAALTADEIAQEAEFFSFGTNDLTQMTFGFSRDDASKFLYDYYEKRIFDSDPFARIDEAGVGALLKIACEKGRESRPNIKLGICGEHGGDPASIAFCAELGLEYVSCSPFRVPVARLAAAQAAIKSKEQ